jgi:hypothetical protein
MLNTVTRTHQQENCRGFVPQVAVLQLGSVQRSG